MKILESLNPILFIIFVAFILWLTWIPLGYLFKNLGENDFDFYRDLTFLSDSIKKRYRSIFCKIAVSYICLYLIINFYKIVIVD